MLAADHLSGLKHGVTKATRTHEGWSAAGSATVAIVLGAALATLAAAYRASRLTVREALAYL